VSKQLGTTGCLAVIVGALVALIHRVAWSAFASERNGKWCFSASVA